MAKIFIGYRHDDGGYAGRLYDRLAATFSPEAVFFDRENLIAGRYFRPELVQAVCDARVCLVVIGQHWLSERNRRRLFESNDVTCGEIRIALECVATTKGQTDGYALIPILAGNAGMPTADDLPTDIAELSELQAHTLDERCYATSVEALIDLLVEQYGMQRARSGEMPARLSSAASTLLQGGRRVWCAFDVVAPFGLEVLPTKETEPPTRVSLADAVDLANAGKNLVLCGEGGIGKTTALLELGAAMQQQAARTPLFIDAAAWGATKSSLLDYLVNLTPLRLNNIGLDELLRFNATNPFTILLNGWNEIPSSEQATCLSWLQNLMATAPNVNVVIATRWRRDTAGLVAPKIIRINGLIWSGQKALIRGALDEMAAASLVTKLALDTRLRLAARNPMVLTGIVQLQRDADESAHCLFDIIGATVDRFEHGAQRSAALQAPPLLGVHRSYLEAIACAMNRNQGATLPIREARIVLRDVSKMLCEQGQIAEPLPQPNSVLEVLCDWHLLIKDGDMVRFAHQRFQEYFAAAFLLTTMTDAGRASQPESVILEAINWPFWMDALVLLAEKLSTSPSLSDAKVSLVEAAMQIDLSIACELAGIAALRRNDAPTIYDGIVTTVGELWRSTDERQREYALGCMIDSQFATFGAVLWPLLEDQDQQVRWGVYRLRRSGISLSQLGGAAMNRVRAWSPEQRAEFVHEIAANPIGFKFVEHLANDDPAIEVRAAAICKLAWRFPGSDAALNAWKRAPDELKTDLQVLAALEEDLLEQVDSMSDELIRLAEAASDNALKLKLGLAFCDVIGIRACDAVLETLHNDRNPYERDRLLAFARRLMPDRLAQVAKERVLTRRGSPEWVRQEIAMLPSEARAILFSTAWDSLADNTDGKFDIEIIGACANRRQTHDLTMEWLEFTQDNRVRCTVDDDRRGRHHMIGDLLACVSGDDLLGVVVELGEQADYARSADLLSLIVRCMPQELAQRSDKEPWIPSRIQVDELIRLFWGKGDIGQIPRNDIKSSLCSIATRSSTDGYIDLVLAAVRYELEAWAAFDECMLTLGATAKRPSNPSNCIILAESVARCGFETLPELISLLSHPSANHFLSDVIIRILAAPWRMQCESRFMTPIPDGAAAKMRRDTGKVLQQPDLALQAATDQAAAALVSVLEHHLTAFDKAAPTRPKPTNPYRIARPNGRLVQMLAGVPSPMCLAAVCNALARGDFDEFSMIDSLCALVMQGAFIEDSRVVRLLETLCDSLEARPWLDNSARSQLNRVHSLFYFVRPVDLLCKTTIERLTGWRKMSHWGVEQALQQLGVPQAWDSLLCIARTADSTARENDAVFHAIVAGIGAETIDSFISILRDGTFFGMNRSAWEMERIAGRLVQAMRDDAGKRAEVLSICTASMNPVAEALACAVLLESNASEHDIFEFGLGMLETGSLCNGGSPTFEMVLNMFKRSEPHEDGNSYSIYARSCNELRSELFRRTIADGPTASTARSILLDIEASRQGLGRPTDEPRNPDMGLERPFHAIFRLNG